MEKVGDDTAGIAGKTFIVQGFGNVGYWVSKFIERDGGKVTHIIERDSAIYKADGIDIEHAKAHLVKHGSFHSYNDADTIEVENPLKYMEKSCDYLIPAATELSVHKHNAPNLKCKAVFEGANGPTTYQAEEILEKRGIVCCPDLLVNGGGVTCSYFEWLKNIDHVSPGKMTKKFDEQSQIRMLNIMGYTGLDEQIKGADEIDIVYSALDEIMTNAVHDNWKYAMDNELNFRDACLVRAINKVYEHYKVSGVTS